MAHVEANLRSFDADLRFMALNDLITQLSNGSAIPTSGAQAAAIACLGDVSLEVQNLATKAAGLMAKLNVGTILQMTLEQECPESIRGVALAAIFSNADLRALRLTSVLNPKLGIPQVVSTLEGVDALYIYATRSPHSAELVPCLLHLLNGDCATRVYDVLAVVLLRASHEQWTKEVLPVLNAQTSSPMLFNLVSRLASSTTVVEYLIPNLADRCIDASLDHENIELCEAALRALAHLVTAAPLNWRTANVDNLHTTAANSLQFYEFDIEDGIDDNYTELEYDSDSDSGFFDESSTVRQAGALFSGALLSSASSERSEPLINLLIESAKRETNEQAKAAIYSALTASGCDLTQLAKLVARDITSSKQLAANSGIAMFASDASSYLAIYLQLVRSAIVKWPTSVSTYIAQLRSVVQDLKQNHFLEKENTIPVKESIEYCVEIALGSVAQPLGRSEAIVDALYIVAELKLTNLLCSVLSLLKPAQAGQIRVSAISTLLKLTPAIEKDQPQSWRDIVANVIPVLQSVPALRNPILKLLKIALSSKHASTELAEQVVFSITEILQVNPSPDSICACIDALRSAPPSVAPQVARAVIQVQSPEIQDVLINLKELFGDQANRVREWAIENAALDLLAQISSPQLAELAFRKSDSSSVHAAASARHVQALGNKYRLDSMPFSELNATQLEVLRVLCHYSLQPWYSINDLMHCKTEPQSFVLGTVLANSPRNEAVRILERLEVEHIRVAAFTAYSKQLLHKTQQPDILLKLMAQHQTLRSAEGAAHALDSIDAVNEFVSLFANEPQFLVNSLKILDHSLLGPAIPRLGNIATSRDLETDLRVEALSTLRWALLREEQYDQLTSVVKPLIIPDPSTVSVINIGPFKHQVDAALPLRLEAMETLLAVARRSHPDNSVVELVIDHSLDDQHPMKLLAYRLLGIWGDSSEVQAHKQAIYSAMHQLNAPKETAGKIDMEQYTELINTVKDTKRKIGF